MSNDVDDRMKEYKEACDRLTREYCKDLLCIVVDFEAGGVGVYFGSKAYEENPHDGSGVKIYDITAPYTGCGDELEMNMVHLIFPGDGTMIKTVRWGEGDSTSTEVKRINYCQKYPLGDTDVDLPVINTHFQMISRRCEQYAEELMERDKDK